MFTKKIGFKFVNLESLGQNLNKIEYGNILKAILK